ncbi:hypothetical protein Z950_2042 [Sulfitobacter mediterraneus KCTC 32188]|nr:hypothetical protein Z950_2042 [Sulfitobacter mediterraneus KCTC 32188]
MKYWTVQVRSFRQGGGQARAMPVVPHSHAPGLAPRGSLSSSYRLARVR